jgi:hypothetical protein
MHYIRLLRPVSVDFTNPNAPVLSAKLAITTDLGDTFLSPSTPIRLLFEPGNTGHDARDVGKPLRPRKGSPDVLWKAGMRVLKVDLPIPKAMARGRATLHIRARDDQHQLVSARVTAHLLRWRMDLERENSQRNSQGLIAPLTVELDNGVGSDVGVRELVFCQPAATDQVSAEMHPDTGRWLRIEEDIGESIARHIWDAGLVSVALLADACQPETPGPHIRDLMPFERDRTEINILELGCGVGVLGIGIATLLHAMMEAQGIAPSECRARVLLTDLPEAQERANANIGRFKESAPSGLCHVELAYENLDWEDGANGRFGTSVVSRFWDYIVLSDCTYNVDSFPVLVGTLSALHRRNQNHPSGDDAVPTKVILSTKPRHDSEKGLFDLLGAAGWTYRLLKDVPLPRLNEEGEVVEVYSLEKQDGEPEKGTKRKMGSDEGEPPTKRTSTTPAQ